jgi:hypothetical protein
MTLLSLALVAVLAGDPDSTKVTGDFQNASLSDILENLTLITQVPVELDASAKKKLGDPSKLTLTVKFNDISLTAAAKLIFGPHGLEVKVVDAKKLLVTVTP